MLLVTNKKPAEFIIIHLCGATECKYILAETDYRFKKYTA
jgi:hypothetical protein